MKKFVSFALALTLVAALLVMPALAAEETVDAVGICPGCGRGLETIGTERVYDSITVASCSYYSRSHTHVRYKIYYETVCEDGCGYRVDAGTSGVSKVFCGASNMWLGLPIVHEIM